jgi:hypothetical protein
MGRLLLLTLPATGAIIYRCKHCDTHLAYDTDIIARVRVGCWLLCFLPFYLFIVSSPLSLASI